VWEQSWPIGAEKSYEKPEFVTVNGPEQRFDWVPPKCQPWFHFAIPLGES
jgi:hypothetical protein